MSDSLERKPHARPWHLWVLGILGLLSSGLGAFDYLMTVTRNEAYLAQVPQETLEYYYAFPTWAFVLFAVGSYGGVIGALLLLLRKAISLWFLAASLVSAVTTTVYTYAFRGGIEVTGVGGLVTAMVFLAFGALVVVYAHRMEERGVLT